MKLFKKLFAEKLLRFYEGTNAGIRYMGMIPGIKNHIKEETFAENSKARLAVGIFAQLFMVLWEFIKKLLYVFALIYIPYRIKMCIRDRSNLRNSAGCNIYGRRLTDEDIKKASMVIGLNLFMAVAALLIISGMQNFNFEDLCIEVFSAVGTVGLSTGITRQLNTCSQIVIMLLMFGGRIGTVTFASSFAYNKKQVKLMNPEENVSVG